MKVVLNQEDQLILEKRKVLNLQKDLSKTLADLEYIAMMQGTELAIDGGDSND